VCAEVHEVGLFVAHHLLFAVEQFIDETTAGDVDFYDDVQSAEEVIDYEDALD
jgi:hypothetical protein